MAITATAPIVAQIDAHNASFPRESSHYSLDTSKKFISAELSVRKMHVTYLELLDPGVVPSEESDDEGSSGGEDVRGACCGACWFCGK